MSYLSAHREIDPYALCYLAPKSKKIRLVGDYNSQLKMKFRQS